MKRLGSILMMLGALIGFAVGIGLATGIKINGISFLVAVGLVKLTLVGSLGLIAAGAGLRRLGIREEQRRLASSARQ